MDSSALDPALGLGSNDDGDVGGENGLLALAQHHHPLPPPPTAELHLSAPANDPSQHPQPPDHLSHQQQQDGLIHRQLGDHGGNDLDSGVGGDAFHLFDSHAGYHQEQHHLHHAASSDHRAALDALPDPPSASAPINGGHVDLDGHGLGVAGSHHGAGEPNSEDTAGPSTSSRTPRPPTIPIACARCRKQKLKCSGGRPCERCAKKGLPADEPGGCEYVAEIRRRGLGKKNRKNGDEQAGVEGGGTSATPAMDGQFANGDGSGSQAALHHAGQHDWHNEAYPTASGAGGETHPSYGLHEADHHHNDGDVLAAHANAEAGPSNYGRPSEYAHDGLHQLHAHGQPSIDPALEAAPTASTSEASRSGSAIPVGGSGGGRLPLAPGGPAGDALGFSPTSIQAMDLLDFAGLNADELSMRADELSLRASFRRRLAMAAVSCTDAAVPPVRPSVSHAATRMPDLPAPPTPSSSSAVYGSQLGGVADRNGRSIGAPTASLPAGSLSPSRYGDGGQQALSSTTTSTGDVKPAVPLKTPIACGRCRAHKLRCPTPPPGPCERCMKAGVGAECAYADQIRRRGESKRKRSEAMGDSLAGPSAGESGKRARAAGDDDGNGTGRAESLEHDQTAQAEVDPSLFAEPSSGSGHGDRTPAAHDAHSADPSSNLHDGLMAFGRGELADAVLDAASVSHIGRTQESALREGGLEGGHGGDDDDAVPSVV